MKKILAAALVATTLAMPATQAHADAWVAPLIGGVIIGGVLADINRPRYYVGPPPVVYAAPPVYVNPNPYGVPPNPYLYQYPRQCRLENIYDGAGYLIGQRQLCN